jgi:selenocysteine lyase/cysteine desulfurase
MVTDHFAAKWIARDQFQLREDAKRFETWEANWAARSGLLVAINELLNNAETIYQNIQQKAQQLRGLLSAIDHIELCDTGHRQSAIISFRSLKMAAPELHQWLEQQGFLTSLITSDAGMLDLKRRQLQQLNRVSVHIYNHEKEFSRLVTALENL